MRSKLTSREFNAADLRGRHDVTGDADDEKVAEALVKYQLDRHSRIGTGEDDRERILSTGHANLVRASGDRLGVYFTSNEAPITFTECS